jgi:DNA-binding HxlR family transcriptional regulator
MKNIKDYSEMKCPMDGLLKLLSGPWTTYILWLIRSNEELRFGQIKKQMPGISAKVLTERLKMLEEAGVISRHQENTIPPKVSYRFTKRGKELNKTLDSLNSLAQKWAKN